MPSRPGAPVDAACRVVGLGERLKQVERDDEELRRWGERAAHRHRQQ
ncbi:hypothetical protein ACFP51_04790 [Streptomyces pratens]|uniref:Uncharacterized protein n=1 Tax=Streptomyces pratens TaxID=887456 RepID=A0ABW1LUV3_9ACTN